ncbi:MAG: biotin/lipoyl-containing protein [Anaerocolumna sp.]
MKNYTITVNGVAYDVTVEENTGRRPALAPAAPVQAAPAAAPIAQAAPPQSAPVQEAAPAPKAGGTAGSVKVNSPMPGKILALKANIGQSVKHGDVILILEAMKMENEIVAPEDGVVASVNVSTGDMVEAGSLLATLN